MDDLNDFKTWLIENTSLSESSILLYVRTIKHYFRHNSEISVEKFNKYISDRFREKRSYYVKYAFKYYLKYKGNKNIYSDLVSVRTQPKLKHGTYLPNNIINRIINNIPEKLYRTIGIIQYATGARAREIITLKEENIDHIESKGVYRLWLHGKGNKERPSFINESLEIYLKPFLRNQPGYMFIEILNPEDKFEFERVINNTRTYYYIKLRKSAEELGIDNLGTHDLRRNASESMRESGADIKTVKEVMGHSSIKDTEKYFKNNPEDVRNTMLRHQERTDNDRHKKEPGKDNS